MVRSTLLHLVSSFNGLTHTLLDSPVHTGVLVSLQTPFEHVAELVPLRAKPRLQL